MGFGDDEDKPLSQEELDKLKNIAQEEPSMEEKPRKVEKEGITIQPKNPLLKKVKKKSKKVVKKISGSAMEEKPSAEVAMEEKPSAEPIFINNNLHIYAILERIKMRDKQNIFEIHFN